MLEYLLQKGELTENFMRVRRGVVTCVLCESVKVTPIFDRLIFKFKFLNIETIDAHNQKGHFVKLSSIVYISKYLNVYISRSKIANTLTLTHNRHAVTPVLA